MKHATTQSTKIHRLLLFVVLLAGSPAFGSQPPNIIFILSDDLGYGETGFNGQKNIETPHLDQMAKDGAVFTDFYAGAPVCGPSRATLLYGLHAGHNPIRGNPRWTQSRTVPELGKDDILLPKEMKRAGYATAHFGKWGMNENLETNNGHPLRQGFDEFVGFNTHGEAHWHWPGHYWNGYEKVELCDGDRHANFRNKETYADDVFQKKALDYIDRKAGEEQPFFMYLCYTIPHLGHTVPTESSDYYSKKGWPKKPGFKGYYEMDDELHAAYAGMISRMDGYVGEILAKLKEKGISENTLVIFTSDNGHAVNYPLFDSNGPLRGKKRDVTEGGIRVPTAAVWPNVIEKGRRIETPLAFWDVLPTFCDIAGIAPQSETDGISFYPALRGAMKEQKQHDVMYWEFNEKKGPAQAIRFGHWKAIRLWDDKLEAIGPIELYDLEQDLEEVNNLAEHYPEVVERAEKLFTEARTEHPEWPLVLMDEAKKMRSKKK
ncbi:MAG TPA: arylsulfatase [Pontiella sp.]